MLRIIKSGKQSAKKNMETDQRLLNELDPSGSPILHLYEWASPSVTHGYFIDPKDFLLGSLNLDFARRPTGGGLTFHLWDLAFSILIPRDHPGYSENVLSNYKFINDIVLQTMKDFLSTSFRRDRITALPEILVEFSTEQNLEDEANFMQVSEDENAALAKSKQEDLMNELCGVSFNLLPEETTSLESKSNHFCFGKPTKYDVMLGSKKIAGAAQRRKRNAYLHQGSISLCMPDFTFLKKIIAPEIIDAMKTYTYAPFDIADLEEVRKELSHRLQQSFQSL